MKEETARREAEQAEKFAKHKFEAAKRAAEQAEKLAKLKEEVVARDAELAKERQNFEKETLRTQRIQDAMENLKDKELRIRMGGIRHLSALHDESQENHWTIIEILAAFVREADPDPNVNILRVDVQEALKVIIHRKYSGSETPDQNINLKGAFLRRADLQGADLVGADLRGANLVGADLQGADLQKANLRGADLLNANLQGIILQIANIHEANLEGASLFNANLQSANLLKASLQGADLQKANITGANLGGVNLKGANLEGADFKGSSLNGARYDGKTIFSDGFKPEDNGMVNKEKFFALALGEMGEKDKKMLLERAANHIRGWDLRRQDEMDLKSEGTIVFTNRSPDRVEAVRGEMTAGYDKMTDEEKAVCDKIFFEKITIEEDGSVTNEPYPESNGGWE